MKQNSHSSFEELAMLALKILGWIFLVGGIIAAIMFLAKA